MEARLKSSLMELTALLQGLSTIEWMTYRDLALLLSKKNIAGTRVARFTSMALSLSSNKTNLLDMKFHLRVSIMDVLKIETHKD